MSFMKQHLYLNRYLRRKRIENGVDEDGNKTGSVGAPVPPRREAEQISLEDLANMF